MEGAFFIIFVTVFLAELGDKTQLTTIAFASKYGWKISFLGAITALALVNLIGAIIGEKLGDALPASAVHKVAGVLFILFGVLMLFDKI